MTTHTEPIAFLGGLTAETFLRDHWQKKPLFVPNAFPHLAQALSPKELQTLARNEDMQSRLVLKQNNGWDLQHGPFSAHKLSRLPARDWSLLVQGINHVLPAAAELLQSFPFIPSARLDDVMVSLAPTGGGVGPHFDSYDVFLIQGCGSKRWQISAQQDQDLIEGIPLRILQRFAAEQEWLVNPGDLLYLPPRYAHHGVSLTDDSMTWSVGFRAPQAQELGQQFLMYLEERLQLNGMYADPDLQAPAHPAEIGPAMIRQVGEMLRRISWTDADVADFLGHYLTEPKPHIFFEAEDYTEDEAEFAALLTQQGIRLAPASQMLFSGNHFYLNGEAIEVPQELRPWLVRLADTRRLPAAAYPPELAELLFPWFEAAYLERNSP